MADLKTVLITGANRGIGLQVAKDLSQRGFHIILGARDRQAGEQARQEIVGTVDVLELDVSSEISIQKAVARLGEDLSLDVLINNAGIYQDQGFNIQTVSRERLDATFQTNAFGPLSVTQAFLPALRRAAHSRVINVSSGYGQLGGLAPDVPSYCLSKLTLNGITLMLSRALKSNNISVNSVCPGWVQTDMGGQNADRTVEEGADSIVWLASEAPQSLTGKFIRDREEIPW
ncbi:SDR family NAD(P)-dependent oxidoreductase [Planctomicrobium sp. SH664]|uniref:SDR family NAD(P)-dependent oxidoreductase n=1 Tax=Planctomicrobium sp. SH664 TaxID=3448125 RepID=UPI003F5BFA38